jgi:hypothetical protein
LVNVSLSHMYIISVNAPQHHNIYIYIYIYHVSTDYTHPLRVYTLRDPADPLREI